MTISKRQSLDTGKGKAMPDDKNDKFTAQVGDFVFEKKPPANSEKNFRRILDTGKKLPPNPMQKGRCRNETK